MEAILQRKIFVNVMDKIHARFTRKKEKIKPLSRSYSPPIQTLYNNISA